MDKTEKLIDWEENERADRNRNGIDDEIEPPIPDISAGSANLRHRLKEDGADSLVVTGGDVDARFETAEGSGDESAVSSMTTPEQNQVSDIGRAMGIEYADDEELKVGEKERERDRHRWELDPASSEDYRDRVNDKT
ncbi:MAG: hypothetical protein JWO97_1274 [Acidobacteria bacterium]|nr:hypothetical protein [Acidobacteriota bacterium]